MAFSIALLNPPASLKLPSAPRPAAPAAPATDVPDRPVLPLPDLEDLALAAPRPLSLVDLAALAGCSSDLLERVAARRQPLPGWLVGPIARELGVDPADVRGAAGEVLELPARVAFAETPLAPDRALGDPLYPRPLRATAPVVFPGA